MTFTKYSFYNKIVIFSFSKSIIEQIKSTVPKEESISNNTREII